MNFPFPIKGWHNDRFAKGSGLLGTASQMSNILINYEDNAGKLSFGYSNIKQRKLYSIEGTTKTVNLVSPVAGTPK